MSLQYPLPLELYQSSGYCEMGDIQLLPLVIGNQLPQFRIREDNLEVTILHQFHKLLLFLQGHILRLGQFGKTHKP